MDVSIPSTPTAVAVPGQGGPLFEAYFGLMEARVIMAGSKMGVFAALAEQPDDAAGLAARLGCDSAGVDALLVALRSMDYLDLTDDGLYEPGAPARLHLVPDAPVPLGELIGGFTYDMWELFSQLEETVESGVPVGLHEDAPDDAYWGRYMRGLYELSALRSGELCELIPTDSPLRLLDIAGGHGGYSVAMCKLHPGLRAHVVELEGAARIGRQTVAEAGMAERIDYEVTDMFGFEAPGAYDVAMANSILHHLDAERSVELLEVGRRALRPGGTMAVIEMERPPDGERGTRLGGVTGVLFYLTSKVRTWSALELCRSFEAAGFEQVQPRRSELVPGIVVVTGIAPGDTQTSSKPSNHETKE